MKAKLLRERDWYDFKKWDIVEIKENWLPKKVWNFVWRYKIEWWTNKNWSPPVKEEDVEIF